MDEIDRKIINEFQGDFPICAQPYKQAAEQVGIEELELISRIEKLLDNKTLSRFGPMYHAEKLGGGLTLATMKLPEEEFERIADIVNALPEVAHNYQRDHALNMWFVLATETPEQIDQTVKKIEEFTGYKVYNMPKIEEFYIGLRFAA